MAEEQCAWEELYAWRGNYAGPWLLFRGHYLINLGTKEHSSNANRRLTILLAALKLYRLEKGTYPAKLRDLVPHYIESMPQDPFSHEGWVYTRESGKLTLSSHEAQQEEDKHLAITFVED